MAFSQKLFTSLHNYADPETRIGELNRIWYDSINNVFRIQLDKTTPGGTVIGGGGGSYTLPTATTSTLGGVKIGTNVTVANDGTISVTPGTGTGLIVGQDDPTINRPIIYDATFENTLSIGTQTFYTHTNGFSVNENFDITNLGTQSNFTGYHFTSGAGKTGVAFTLARTGYFTDGFGITGDASNNQFVIGSETANTDYVFKTGIGMPFNVSGGTTIFTINRDGSIRFADDTLQTTAAVAQIQSDWNQTTNTSLDYIKNKPTIPDIGPIQEVFSATTEPMGHADKSQSTISFNDSTRTFTISPVSGSYNVWVKGVKFVISTTRTVTIPNTTGLYYIYFDAAGALQYQTTFFDWPNQAPTAYVYWNSGTGKAPMVADERHGIVLDWQTHEYLHRTRGAAIANGFGASNYILNGAGNLNTHIQLDIASGTFFDEDLEVDVVSTNTPTANTWEQDLTGPSQIPIFYLSGTTGWVRDNPTTFPLKRGSVRPVYNLNTAGTWSTPDIDNNKFGATFIIATNNINYPVMGVISQTQHANQSDAEAINWSDLNLTGFPIVEFRPLYKVVYQTKTSYSNTPKATIVSLWDLRSFSSVTSAAASFVDANALSGTVLAPTVVTSSLTTVGTLGSLTVTYTPGTAIGSAITATGKDTQGGTGYFDFLRATNTTSGATNPNKTFRLNSTGAIEIINSAYTTTLMSLSDTGFMSTARPYQVAGKQAVNGPAFRAFVPVGQTITSGSQQKVTFGGETFDTDNCFGDSTYTFTPTLEGYYQFNATIRISGTAGTGEVMLVLYKNGSEYARGTNEGGTEQGASWYSMQVSDIAYANGTTDNFELYIQQTSGASRTTTAGSTISYFSGVMVRGA